MKGYRYKTQWHNKDVWVYQQGEPAGINLDMGPASCASEITMPEEVEKHFKTTNSLPARAVIVDDGGSILWRDENDWGI